MNVRLVTLRTEVWAEGVARKLLEHERIVTVTHVLHLSNGPADMVVVIETTTP